MSEARRIDLNADLGEGVTDDPGLLAVVTSANVACGYHAGDVATMTTVCEVAVRHGVVVGAQVSYADRENFGRVALDTAYDELRHHIADQVFTLTRIARRAGLTVAYVKPHGALYHACVTHPDQAEAVAAAAHEYDPSLAVLAAPGSPLLAMADGFGMEPIAEAFADRAYRSDGMLVPRSEPGSVLTDPASVAARAVAIATERAVTAVDGTVVKIDARSICIHGDTPGAVALARAVRTALEDAGVGIYSFTG